MLALSPPNDACENTRNGINCEQPIEHPGPRVRESSLTAFASDTQSSESSQQAVLLIWGYYRQLGGTAKIGILSRAGLCFPMSFAAADKTGDPRVGRDFPPFAREKTKDGAPASMGN